MSSIPFPILFIMLVFFTMWLILRKFHRIEEKKRNLPELGAYLQAHAQSDARCIACGATELEDQGLTHGEDERRIVSCGKCRTLLYRFVRPAAE
ncbi:hypothetical protein MX652_02175 [Thauera aromatica]|nr:hypothetical protein [Thauera aromatica]MCK2125495.1 hypothetical protein [Thauera aromatica]